jgi:hypothetical protein
MCQLCALYQVCIFAIVTATKKKGLCFYVSFANLSKRQLHIINFNEWNISIILRLCSVHIPLLCTTEYYIHIAIRSVLLGLYEFIHHNYFLQTRHQFTI